MVLFPIFLKLAGRRCLVVGAGKIAEGKIASLLTAEAMIHVVAPRSTQTIQRWAKEERITWDARPFEPGDLEQVSVVITATDSEAVNQRVFQEARAREVLCNSVDDPEHCDFYYPAIVRRGPLQIAISTGGNSPALAQRLRRDLEQQFVPEYEDWVSWLGEARASLFARALLPHQRRSWLHNIASDWSFQRFRRRSSKVAGERTFQVKGKVYLVGAGPGDPELLTLKAVRVLREAEIVLHDALVSPEVLAVIPPTAIVLHVGKRCGQPSVPQHEINALLTSHANCGRVVVRLKSGDPLIFGRAGEEMEALRAAGIPFEIVPGITAALGAAAVAQVPLTDRRLASRLVIATNHHALHEIVPDWRIPPSGRTTFVLYMPGSDYGQVAAQMSRSGLSGETPCLIVSRASTPQQQLCMTNLRDLALVPPLPAPAVMVFGNVSCIAWSALAAI
jgi:uroporphyrin-III C-methyltransferase/precorrin-2 dehydrogenase/sirohydrochlorin ferrochelatase